MKITQLTKLALVIFALGGLAACSSTSEDVAADSSQTEQTTNSSSESGQSAAEAAAAAAEEEHADLRWQPGSSTSILTFPNSADRTAMC